MLSIGKKVCKAEARTTSVRIIYLDGHKIVAQHISINDPHKTVKKRKVALMQPSVYKFGCKTITNISK